MKNQIYPCLWYDGKAKVAADFYCTIFKDSKITTDTSLVVNFELNGKQFMGLNGGPKFKQNPSISFFVLCKSDLEIQSLWTQLTDEGKVLMPLDKYPWNEQYGWLEDKFGLSWQLMRSDINDSSPQIYPSLLFTGNQFGRAEEAINYYTSLFPSSSIETLNFYEEGEQLIKGKISYAEFTIGNTKFAAMDGAGDHAFNFNEAISFVVECDTQDEIDRYWDELSKEGQEDQCGWLKDKFGISWQIIPRILGQLMSDSERAPRVMQAFLKMKKFDIETLINA